MKGKETHANTTGSNIFDQNTTKEYHGFHYPTLKRNLNKIIPQITHARNQYHTRMHLRIPEKTQLG